MNEQNTGFEIKPEQRQSWVSIAMIWAGGMICVPCLMIGGVLAGGGLSISQILLSIIIGYGLICAYMILIGMQSCDLGLPVSVMASSSLGKTGSRFIISLLLAIACIGWFGIQSATCGVSFATMVYDMLGKGAPGTGVIAISSIVWGLIMLLTACFGFKGLKWLNYIAVPLLLIVCIYGVSAGIAGNGIQSVFSYAPAESSGLVYGISMVVASFALGGVISGDYCRFAKSRGDVAKSSILGVIPAGLFILMVGSIMSIVTGQYDITAVLSSVGVPFLGLIALVLATWTTNVTNAYSGGLALSNMLGFDESKFKFTTGIAGLVGTILAAVGLLGKFTVFLSFMSALIPPLAGVIIADYWIIKKGNKDNFAVRSGFNAAGIIAFIIGALAACVTGGSFLSIPGLTALYLPFFVGPVNGIVVSMIVYVIIAKIAKIK